MTANDDSPVDVHYSQARPGTRAGMPLGARRLIMVGGLCLPVGLIGGSYLLLLQLLALGGVCLIAVALSYREGARWLSRLSWTAAAAGALWTAFTAAYWLSVISAADASAPLPGYASVLFNAGGASVAVMAAAAGTAVVRRMIRAARSSATKS